MARQNNRSFVFALARPKKGGRAGRERRQMAMVVQCPDDLVGPSHPVRSIMAVVERLEVSRFCESIKAREGEAGRDATDPC